MIIYYNIDGPSRRVGNPPTDIKNVVYDNECDNKK